MFSEDQRFWILAYVFRGLRIFGLWLMFSKGQRFYILAHVFRGGLFLSLSSLLGQLSCFPSLLQLGLKIYDQLLFGSQVNLDQVQLLALVLGLPFHGL